jgi:hypothetical protein
MIASTKNPMTTVHDFFKSQKYLFIIKITGAFDLRKGLFVPAVARRYLLKAQKSDIGLPFT